MVSLKCTAISQKAALSRIRADRSPNSHLFPVQEHRATIPRGTPMPFTFCRKDQVANRLGRLTNSEPAIDTVHHSPRVKVTVTVISTATGSPFNKVGWYFHCRTA